MASGGPKDTRPGGSLGYKLARRDFFCTLTEMLVRQKRYGPGSRVKVHPVKPYPFPADLPVDALVTVVALDHGAVTVEYEGQSFEVMMHSIDSGWQYELHGRWLEVGDPHVLAEKERARKFGHYGGKIGDK